MRRVLHDPLTQLNGSLVLFTAIGVVLIDRMVLAIGALLGEGSLLAGLNLGRLWLNALVTPLLIVTYVEYTGRLKIKSAQTRTIAGVVWGLAWLIVGLQAWESWPKLALDRLVPVEQGGLLYYAPEIPLAEAGTLAANTIGVIFGAFILLRTGWPVALLGIGLVWGEALFYPQTFMVVKGLEVLWLWALVLTEWRAEKEGMQIKRSELDTRLGRLG
jgi:hypothetical protein